MKILTTDIELQTKGFTDIIDITPKLENLLKETNFVEGYALIFVSGATGGLTTIEYEPGLKKDLLEFFERWIPMNQRYHHDDTWHDGNGYAHLRASLVKPSLQIPFNHRKFLLGTWQQVIFIDFDNRPRHRNLVVQFYGLTE